MYTTEMSVECFYDTFYIPHNNESWMCIVRKAIKCRYCQVNPIRREKLDLIIPVNYLLTPTVN